MATNQSKQSGSNEGRSRGGQNSSGNFKHDPQRAAEAGRKGGEARSRNMQNNSNQNDGITDLRREIDERRDNMGGNR